MCSGRLPSPVSFAARGRGGDRAVRRSASWRLCGSRDWPAAEGRHRRPRRRPPTAPGTSASSARAIIARASADLVANSTSSDTLAAAHRSGSLLQDLGQVQLPVDYRVPGVTGIGQMHRDLGVFDPSGGLGVLTLGPHRRRPLLDIAGLIDHQYAVRVTQVLDDVAAQVIAHPIGVPVRPREQVLCMPSGLVGPVCSAIVQSSCAADRPAARSRTPEAAAAARPARTGQPPDRAARRASPTSAVPPCVRHRHAARSRSTAGVLGWMPKDRLCHEPLEHRHGR